MSALTPRRAAGAFAALALLTAITAGCGGNGGPEAADRDRTTTTERRTTTTTEAVDENAETVEAFVRAFATNDRAALNYLAPGSMALVYVDGTLLIAEADPTTEPQTASQLPDGGWRVGRVKLDGFQVVDGTISDLNRNAVQISTTVAPGDGQVYEARPNEFDEWTGVVRGRVHSFRHLDGNVQIVTVAENAADASGSFTFEDYAADGQQYGNVWGDEVRPGVTRAFLNVFEAAPAGGTAYGNVWVDCSGSVPNPGQTNEGGPLRTWPQVTHAGVNGDQRRWEPSAG